jgi:hypothetical protein
LLAESKLDGEVVLYAFSPQKRAITDAYLKKLLKALLD